MPRRRNVTSIALLGVFLVVGGIAWRWASRGERAPSSERDASTATPRGEMPPPRPRATNDAKGDLPLDVSRTSDSETLPPSDAEPPGRDDAWKDVRGVVVDPSGAPIAKASVLALAWRGELEGRTTTASDGSFCFDPLVKATRYLHVSSPGRVATVVYFGELEHWSVLPRVEFPARIVLEAGVVAVARLRWTDGTPCAGTAVFLGPAREATTGIWDDPYAGPWPPAVTDATGRVELCGLPPKRLLGLGIALYGRNIDSPRPLATGDAPTAATAVEQLFTYARLAKLTVELHGLEALQAQRLKGYLSLERQDGFRGDATRVVPPTTCCFDDLVFGARYRIDLQVVGRKRVDIAHALKITELDQRLVVDATLPPPAEPLPDPPHTFVVVLRLLHSDGTPITQSELVASGGQERDLRVRCGSLAPGRSDVKPEDVLLELESPAADDRRGLTGRLGIAEPPPLWIEAELGNLRSRVELDSIHDETRVDFHFDLASLAPGSTRVSFHARDEQGGDVTLVGVELVRDGSEEVLTAGWSETGEIARSVPPGRWRYGCFADGGREAHGVVDVPPGSPIAVDVVLPDAGAVREKAPSRLVAALEHWKQDPDFASVRDRLGDLPGPERDAWRGLWAAVDLSLATALPAAK